MAWLSLFESDTSEDGPHNVYGAVGTLHKRGAVLSSTKDMISISVAFVGKNQKGQCVT